MHVTVPMDASAARAGGGAGGARGGTPKDAGTPAGVDTFDDDCPRTALPRAGSVLAVVGRPGDEAYYLGAVLDAFRAGGTKVSALVFTRGEAAPHEGSANPASIGPSELEVAALVLRATHRLLLGYRDGGLGEVPAAERTRHVIDMIARCSADLLLTAEAGTIDSLVIEATCAAGRAAGVPVLAWTLPADVATAVRAAGGRGAPDHPRPEPDFAVRLTRSTQRRAMRAHRSQAGLEHVQLARLDVQGDREWLHWLVPPEPAA